MYSKDQASQLKQAFWTAFGKYIAPQLSSDGLKINWINYKTGIKHLYFKMHADQKNAFIAIEIANPDLEIQELIFEQFKAYQKIFSETIISTLIKSNENAYDSLITNKNQLLTNDNLQEEWEWQLHIQDEHYKTVSRIIKYLPDVSIFKQEDWPALISFLKPRMIALDEFWSDAQYSFDSFK